MQHRESLDADMDAYATMLAWILHGISARSGQPLLAYFVGMALEVAIAARKARDATERSTIPLP